tara:strand:+ start:1190 stop:1759 length:570 start_codon:yes stop_codon:yes gene_type:complete
MKTEPIRNVGKVKAIIKYLDKHNYPRDAMLFRLGVNTALRVSDLLKLRYCDIINDKDDFREYINLREQKTKKAKKIALNGKIKPILKDYCSSYELFGNDFLFFSYKNPHKAIDRIQAWRVLTPAAKYCGIENFGCHSMRKTFAYHLYQKNKSIAEVMEVLNHKSPLVTMRYIGINQDQIDKAYQDIYFD